MPGLLGLPGWLGKPLAVAERRLRAGAWGVCAWVQVVKELVRCHEVHYIAKFWGKCNDAKAALDKCFKVDVSATTRAGHASPRRRWHLRNCHAPPHPRAAEALTPVPLAPCVCASPNPTIPPTPTHPHPHPHPHLHPHPRTHTHTRTRTRVPSLVVWQEEKLVRVAQNPRVGAWSERPADAPGAPAS
jgi:hypothetical protein